MFKAVNPRLSDYLKRKAYSASLPNHAVRNILCMFHYETELIKRGRRPCDHSKFLADVREANHLVNKGLIFEVKPNLYCLTWAGIIKANELLVGGYDADELYPDPARMDEIFPYEDGCTDPEHILELMMDWGFSLFDTADEGPGFPPISIQQVCVVEPYQESYS